jgi:hypothetical protein
MKIKLFLIAALVAVLAFTSCSEDNPVNENPKPEPNYNYNNIMDTLKGEWIWMKTTGGFAGVFEDPEFKSVLKIISQNQDSSINYEVYIADTLFAKSKFILKLDSVYCPDLRENDIILPHYETDRLLFLNDYPVENDINIAFTVCGADFFNYHYSKIKE